MSHNKALDNLTREQLTELLEIYSKNWLAADGIWFQSVEKKHGMEEAMYHDVEIWKKFTVVEALKLKKFLGLPERPGLEGLAKALSLRFYANINDDEIRIEGNTMFYRMVDCRVQTARKRKGMEFHPCKAVGIVEYGEFARAIDDRITCECVSCYPDITDETCCCSWKFTLREDTIMANANRDFIVEKVKEVLAAPSCCPELKDAAQKYLAALDTADEKAAGKNLIAELEEDVQSIDDTLAFFCSDAAKEIFGAETAANMAETAKKVKASGAKICFCPACTAGKAILDNREALL